MNFFSHIYLRKDASTAYLPGLPVHSVVLEVDGAAAVQPLAMILPTDEPESINAVMIAGWLAAFNGLSVEASGMSASQCEVLLTLICGYRAFLELPPSVKEDNFYTLAHKIIDAAFELTVLQPANQKLCEIADWLEGLLPTKCFLPVLDDSYEARDPGKLSKDNVVSIVTTFASMLDPRVHEVIQDIDLNTILSAAPTSTGSPPPTTSSEPTVPSSRSKSRKSCKKSCKASKEAQPCDAAVDIKDPTSVTSHTIENTPAPIDEVAPSSTSIPSIPMFHTSTAAATAHPLSDNMCARAVTIEEVPDIETNMHHAPVLDVKGKGRAAVLEGISSDDELPGLVDVEDSSDGDSGAEDVVRVITHLSQLA